MISSGFRSLPDFKGKRTLARFLLGNFVESSKDLSIKGKYGCSYFLPNVIENVGFDIMVNGIYEQETFNLLSGLIPKKGSFIDIGANIGAVSVPLCKKRPDIDVIVIEAAPWIFPYLERNIKDNEFRNVRLINNAIFDQDGLLLDFFSPHDKFGKGSLASVFTDQAEKVLTVTLDALVEKLSIKRVDVIKVDVEGFEYFVFKGGHQMLLRDRPSIFFEFVDWAEKSANGLLPGAAQQYLLDLGYDLYIITDSNLRVRIDRPLEGGSFNILAQVSK